ncbi:MAG TPA: cyclic nucleotide-binding domain-containing protein [Candidatus Limnocylindrales bacterium]|nr:cyclic nucleotide-binding domain-containing protein [Candidatus Limnocylindrales bacterium]
MTRDPKVDLLASVPLFTGLGRAELEQLAQLVDEIDVPAGYALMRQGERGDQMFVVVSGELEIDRDGRTINHQGPGAAVGEMSLLAEGARTATVRTTGPARLLVLAHREFHSLMDAHPTVRMRILEGLADKIRTLDPGTAH